MKKKIAIVGTGRIANSHMKAFSKIENNVEVSAVCDINMEVAKKFAEKYNIEKYYDNLDILLKNHKIDALWICTPANTHSFYVKKCIERELPFFLEKPVTIKEEEAEEILPYVNKIPHSVGYMLRYQNTVEQIKELLKKEQVAMLNARWFWTIPLVDSIKSKENAGGQIVDQATHLIDIMRYWIGEIKDIYTRRIRGLFPEEPKYTGDDASVSVFTFQNGIIGSLNCTYALFPEISQRYPAEVLIICKKKLIAWTRAGMKIITPEGIEEVKEDKDGMYEEDKAFLEYLETKDPSKVKSTYEDAYKTIKVCLAANKSMEIEKKIEL